MGIGESGAAVLSGIAAIFTTLFSPGDATVMEIHSINKQWNSYLSSTPHKVDLVYRYSTPEETKQRKSGTDADVSFGKMFTLIQSGYDEKKLSLMVAQDKNTENLKSVVIYDTVDDKGRNISLVLDPHTTAIRQLKDRSELVPVYRVNRYSFDMGSMEILSKHPDALSKWKNTLEQMKEDGKLKGEVFPRRPSLNYQEPVQSAGTNQVESTR